MISHSISDYYSVTTWYKLALSTRLTGMKRKQREREGEKGEDWYEKENFLKNIQCQPAKAFNVLRSLGLQSIWAQKKLVTNMCAYGVSAAHLS